MKAKVKSTGEIVEVGETILPRGKCYINMVGEMIGAIYMEHELDFNVDGKFAENCLNGIKQGIDSDPDYWTRLEHRYAGMAMQGILSNPESELDYKGDETLPQALAGCAAKVAHALVEKMKEEK